MAAASSSVASAERVLEVLDLLFQGDYLVGAAPAEIARTLKLTPSSVTRYLATLEGAGAIERVPDTARVRPSVRWARHAASVLASIDTTARRADEVRTRILTPLT